MGKQTEFFKNSVCKGCDHLVIRSIKLHNLYEVLADLGVPVDELEFNADEVESFVLDHYMCSLLELELDHDVFECNKFSASDGGGGLLGSDILSRL